MNSAVKALQGIIGSRDSSWAVSPRRYLLIISLVVAVLFSALCVVYAKDVNRRLLNQYQTLQISRDQVHTQWSQLLLEKGAWSAQARIQRIAKQKYHMIMPKSKSILLVKHL